MYFYLDSDGNKQCEEQFLTGLSKYFKFTPVSDQHYVLKRLNGEIYHVADGNMLLFLNGSAMIAATFSKESGSYRPCNEINQEGGHLCESPIWLRIDVNGLKGPNTLGRDVFEFIVGEDGIVYPNYGKEQSIYYGNPEYYWKIMIIIAQNLKILPVLVVRDELWKVTGRWIINLF